MPTRTSPKKRSIFFKATGNKAKQQATRELLKKRLSGKIAYTVDGRAYLEGAESLYLQAPDSRTMATRNKPLPKQPPHAYPTRYQLDMMPTNPKKWTSTQPSGGCPLCLQPIAFGHDVVFCHERACVPVHRWCATDYHGRICLCMGLLCDWHPNGRWPNGRVFPNRDRCVSCRGRWFPDLQDVTAKWCAVLSSEIFNDYIEQFLPTIPGKAYDTDYTRLEDNDDFPNHSRSPINVMNDQQNLGVTFNQAMENTWTAYNANHHPVYTGPPPVGIDCSATREQYLGAINEGFFESRYYLNYSYERFIYYHDRDINTEMETQYPTVLTREWFNLETTMNKFFHMTREGLPFFRRLFEIAPPTGLILDLPAPPAARRPRG
jgi:hypothetical protein